MKRRDLIRNAAITFAGASVSASVARAAVNDDAANDDAANDDSAGADRQFAMHFAPHFGMFTKSAGGTLLDELRFAADHGFRAWEDNPMKDRPLGEQQQIASEMERLEMRMGVISALKGVWKAVNFAGNDLAARQAIVDAMRGIVEVAKRVNATYLTVVLGLQDPKLPRDYQTVNCIELLKRCCDVVEPHDLVMVLEPLNTKTNHPGVFLSESPHAYQICRAVGRPSCKILFDIYHQQITEGNLIPNIDACWDEIAYFQCGDNPGRKEPGTGEIHYRNVFGHIAKRGYDGIMGMEHGNSIRGAEGERGVIEAYRKVDPV